MLFRSVRSGSTYTFQDQTGHPELRVTAYDKAGNKKIAVYKENSTSTPVWYYVIGGVVVLVGGYVLYRKIKKILTPPHNA